TAIDETRTPSIKHERNKVLSPMMNNKPAEISGVFRLCHLRGDAGRVRRRPGRGGLSPPHAL
ncbi:MAG: hypothetical protein U1E05_27435, partial [Patescibacteria group bacterium]|nr:hypothetical protein [Patescibacteria group bacterium]